MERDLGSPSAPNMERTDGRSGFVSFCCNNLSHFWKAGTQGSCEVASTTRKGRRRKHATHCTPLSARFVANHKPGAIQEYSEISQQPPEQFSLFPSHRKGNVSSEGLGNFLEVGRARIQIHGHLTGSVGRARGSRSQGREFEPHTGCRDYLNK